VYHFSMQWKILDTGSATAKENMAADATLLNQAGDCQRPILHFYDWETMSATYGYFSKPEKLLDLNAVFSDGIQLARRPTGGGVLFHFTDLAFSIIIPHGHPFYSTNTMQNYKVINTHVENAVAQLLGSKPLLLERDVSSSAATGHFCMGKPTKYDVMITDKKVAGAAQRRTKEGLLHQGTIHLALPDFDELSKFIREPSVLDAMRTNSAGLVEQTQLPDARKEMKSLLVQQFTGVGP